MFFFFFLGGPVGILCREFFLAFSSLQLAYALRCKFISVKYFIVSWASVKHISVCSTKFL